MAFLERRTQQCYAESSRFPPQGPGRPGGLHVVLSSVSVRGVEQCWLLFVAHGDIFRPRSNQERLFPLEVCFFRTYY